MTSVSSEATHQPYPDSGTTDFTGGAGTEGDGIDVSGAGTHGDSDGIDASSAMDEEDSRDGALIDASSSPGCATPGACPDSGAMCGNGEQEQGEACDDGDGIDTNGCTNRCELPRCGDGVVQAGRGEMCDDENMVDGDGCSANCIAGYAPKGATSHASSHLCGVRPNGTVACWGLDVSGQLGRGSASSSMLEPDSVLGVNQAVDVAMVGDTSCAILKDGTALCWGAGFGARATAITGVVAAKQLTAGMGEYCAVEASGDVVCWGTDGIAAVRSGLRDVHSVAWGDRHGCALTSAGAVWCLGGNTAGEAGRGASGPDASESFTLANLLVGAGQVVAGYRYTCIREHGPSEVQCVGEGTVMGNPTALESTNVEPVTVVGLTDAIKLAPGENHVCALTASRRVACWGRGEAAGGTGSSVVTRPFDIALPGEAIDVGAGSRTSCALLEDGSTYCWGSFAATSASATPVLVEF